MSGQFWLDWAVMAVSLFNTIVLLWLGLTVLLNAERRTWGIWLAGGGLLLGGVFFLSHSAIIGHGLDFLDEGINFWWQLGWVPVILAPFAWYIVMLWYAGFWEDRSTSLYRRHRIGFSLSLVMTVVTLALLAVANPLPALAQVTKFNFSDTPSIGGIPALIIFYLVYILTCIGFALDVLISPGPSGRTMGQIARQRARPWLLSASFVLFLVSLLVSWVMAWLFLNIQQQEFSLAIGRTLALFDLAIAVLIACAVVLTGQAVVSYEIFTGKALPRHGLLSYWRRAVILGAGYGSLVSLSLTLQLHPMYSILLSTVLMVVFYALLGWRSFAEQERFITRLRPFITNQQLYDQLLAPASTAIELDVQAPFCALCEDILGARLAYLVPQGSLAPLFGPPLACPTTAPEVPPLSPDTYVHLSSPGVLSLPIEDVSQAGLAWAVPLWRTGGLSGVLLLGEKRDGGLYTQEEIEIARTVGERLMDMQASTELARRLMALQRKQMAESQVLDQQTRRALHDDILPRLHTAMLNLSNASNTGPENSLETIGLLGEVHHEIADLLRELPQTTAPEVARFGLVGALKQVAEGELKQVFDTVDWQITPLAGHQVETIPALQAEVIFYAAREVMRNAARYGRGAPSTANNNSQPAHASGSFCLAIAMDWQNGLELKIEDNGVGIGEARAQTGGSGQGLALHSTLLAVIGGSLAINSIPGQSTRVTIRLPQGAV